MILKSISKSILLARSAFYSPAIFHDEILQWMGAADRQAATRLR
jgi:hypothetical protein